jgi:hypothetical protein
MSDPKIPAMDWMRSQRVAELISAGTKASALMEECTDVKANEGSINVRGILLGKLPTKPTKEGRKAPPDKYRILLVDVKSFIIRHKRDEEAALAELDGEEEAPASYITIKSDTSFSLKAFQSVPKDKALDVLTSGGEPMEKTKVEALILAAKSDGRKNLYIHRGEFTITEGNSIIAACFNPKAASVKPGSLVEVMGTDANAYWGTKGVQGWRMGVNTQSIVVSQDNHDNPVDNFRAFGLLDDDRLPIYDASKPSYQTYIVSFGTTIQKPDFTKKGSFRRLDNSVDPERYFYKNKSEALMQKLQMTMYKRSWDDRGMEHGWDQNITTTVFQWKKDDKADHRIVLAFGIPKVEDFKKFMSVNSVPVVTSSTIDYVETAKLPDPKSGLVLKTWTYWACMQEYLLDFCPRFTWEFLLSKLESKRTKGRIEMNDPNTPNYLNIDAGEKQGGDWIMTGTVVALSSWEGYVADVQQAGCQVRAFINAAMPLAERRRFGSMSVEDALKVIRCEPDAPIRLDTPPSLYFYAVKPREDIRAAMPMDIEEEEEEEGEIVASRGIVEVLEEEEEEEEEEEDSPPPPKRKARVVTSKSKKRPKVVRKSKSKK